MITIKKKPDVNKERRKANKRRAINQDIYRIAAFFAVIFAAMAVFLVWFVYNDSESVANNEYNNRESDVSASVIRGSIYSRDGTVLAYTSIDDDGNETRVYPYGEIFAHVVGYSSKGGLGLELSYNSELLTSGQSLSDKIENELYGTKSTGNSLTTTLDVDLQTKLYEILDGNEGAIIVLKPDTGEVLAMVSQPGFDPNLIDDDWDSISTSEDSVLLNRATQSTATPGSTFKIFTLLEYYREMDGDIDDYFYQCSGSITVNGNTISCVGGTVHGSQDLKLSFAHSCNSSFINIGLQLDLDEFAKNNESMLFGTDLPIDIDSVQSSFALNSDSEEYMVMQTVFGQGETLVSPLHLALVASAVANGGVLMTPHIGSYFTDAYGEVTETIGGEEYARLMTEDEAAFMKEYMRAVVTDGTASIMSGSEYTAYGKTGTAEVTDSTYGDHDHSWFTGFAEMDGETVVVCVMIENSQESGMTGVGTAKLVFDYYFGDYDVSQYIED